MCLLDAIYFIIAFQSNQHFSSFIMDFVARVILCAVWQKIQKSTFTLDITTKQA